MDLGQVGELTEGGLVAKRDVDHAMVSKSAHSRQRSGLLATTHGPARDEQASILAPKATSSPDSAGLVPESLPLGREVTVTSGDTEEDGIVLEEVLGLGNGVRGLGRGVHLAQDFIRKSLGNLVDSRRSTGSFNALLLGLGQLLDVAVHGVLDHCQRKCD